MQISRRELIFSAIAAGTASLPENCDAESLPVVDNIVFITVDRRLSEPQLKQFTTKVWEFLRNNGSKLIPCVLHDGAKIQFMSPYNLYVKLGDYEYSMGCRTKNELVELAREFQFPE